MKTASKTLENSSIFTVRNVVIAAGAVLFTFWAMAEFWL